MKKKRKSKSQPQRSKSEDRGKSGKSGHKSKKDNQKKELKKTSQRRKRDELLKGLDLEEIKEQEEEHNLASYRRMQAKKFGFTNMGRGFVAGVDYPKIYN